MPLWLKSVVLAAAVMVMPLQGVAVASLRVLQCPPADSSVDYSSGDESPVQGHHSDSSGHFSCHQLVPGLPVFPPVAEMPDFPVFETFISLLSSLFLPEQPQRPPLHR